MTLFNEQSKRGYPLNLFLKNSLEIDIKIFKGIVSDPDFSVLEMYPLMTESDKFLNVHISILTTVLLVN